MHVCMDLYRERERKGGGRERERKGGERERERERLTKFSPFTIFHIYYIPQYQTKFK